MRSLTAATVSLSLISATTVNYEDAKRLQELHTDCRIKTFQSWQDTPHFDLGKIIEEAKMHPTFQIAIHRLKEVISQQPDAKLTLQQPDAGSTSDSFNKRITKIVMNNRIIERQKEIEHGQNQEIQLHQQINQCNDKESLLQMAVTLQTLVISTLRRNISQYKHMISVERQIFEFSNIRKTWSIYWHQIRTSWSQRFYMTESQEWHATMHMIRFGQGYTGQSQFYRQYSSKINLETWFQMAKSQQMQFLTENKFARNIKFLGFLIKQVANNGISGPIGKIFGFPQANTICGKSIVKVHKSTESFFARVVQSIMPRDLRSRLYATIHGYQYRSLDQHIVFNALTGQYQTMQQFNAQNIMNTIQHAQKEMKMEKWVQLGHTIDHLLCLFAQREPEGNRLEDYYRQLQAWYAYGRERGQPKPTFPLLFPTKCNELAGRWSNFHDVHSIAESMSKRLHRFWRLNRLTVKEFYQMRCLIDTFESGHVTWQRNALKKHVEVHRNWKKAAKHRHWRHWYDYARCHQYQHYVRWNNWQAQRTNLINKWKHQNQVNKWQHQNVENTKQSLIHKHTRDQEHVKILEDEKKNFEQRMRIDNINKLEAWNRWGKWSRWSRWNKWDNWTKMEQWKKWNNWSRWSRWTKWNNRAQWNNRVNWNNVSKPSASPSTLSFNPFTLQIKPLAHPVHSVNPFPPSATPLNPFSYPFNRLVNPIKPLALPFIQPATLPTPSHLPKPINTECRGPAPVITVPNRFP